MTKRLKAVAGFLAAATLLSGSAFAFAPEFDQDLPTVVITDKLEGEVSPAYDVNGIPSIATEWVFRFSHAFALQDHVIDLQGNSFAQTQFAFTELDSFSDETPNTVHTLLINGDQALDFFPTAAEVDTFGQPVTERYADGGLDFRNRDFSGDDESINSGFNPIGAITGDDIRTTDQQRVVTLFIKGDTSDELVIRDFLTITTIEGNDRLESPIFTSSFEEVYTQDILEGWQSQALAILAAVPASGSSFIILGDGNPDQYSFTPGSPAPAATDLLTMNVGSTEIGFGNWFTQPAFALAESDVYRLRANVYSPNTANSDDTVRLEIGNAISVGQTTVNYDSTAGLPAHTFDEMPSATDGVMTAYLQPEGTASGGTWDVQVRMINGGQGGQDITIDSIAIDQTVAGLSSLGTPAVVFNQGGAISTDGDPTVDPVPSPTPFNTSSTPVAGETWEINTLNSSANITSNLTSSALNVTFPQSNGVAPPAFAGLGLATSDAAQPWLGGAFQVVPGKLYQLDVWASTASPQTAAQSVPDMRIDVSMNGSYSAHLLKDLSPIDTSSNPINGISTTPRAYSLFFEYEGALATAEANLIIQLQSFAKTYPSASTVSINRVTLREYTAP